ncbi:hypothetical protein [Pleionea sediminis]|uniref:hypothetical protein n=1 Tax=Pleionea sediminis TaxID=2569479 RepID=UPI001185FCD7|nr:hypothetical protein [Pleionea sediminis]
MKVSLFLFAILIAGSVSAESNISSCVSSDTEISVLNHGQNIQTVVMKSAMVSKRFTGEIQPTTGLLYLKAKDDNKANALVIHKVEANKYQVKFTMDGESVSQVMDCKVTRPING